MDRIRRRCIAGLAALAVSGALSAAPVLAIDPSALPGGSLPRFEADGAHVLSSVLMTYSGDTATGLGLLIFDSFTQGGVALPAALTGLRSRYGIYGRYQIAETLVSGIAGTNGSTYTVTALNLALYADPNLDTFFTPASAFVFRNRPPEVEGNTGDDVVLAIADLRSGGAAFAQGNASTTVAEDWAVCVGPDSARSGDTLVPGHALHPIFGGVGQCLQDFGSRFFAAPIPFYDEFFGQFVTGPGQTPGRGADGIHVDLQQAAQIGFRRSEVPEPPPWALSLAAFAAIGLRRALPQGRVARARCKGPTPIHPNRSSNARSANRPLLSRRAGPLAWWRGRTRMTTSASPIRIPHRWWTWNPS